MKGDYYLKIININFDGYFDYHGKIIFFRMRDEIKMTVSHEREMVSRMADLYDEDNKFIDSIMGYDTAEAMKNISPAMVYKWYSDAIADRDNRT